MNAPQALLIDNAWVETSQTLPVVNPFTGAEIARAPMGNCEHIEAGIAAAHAAFAKVRATPAHARAKLLLKVAALIEERREDFVRTIIAEAGKPITFAEAEVARAAQFDSRSSASLEPISTRTSS